MSTQPMRLLTEAEYLAIERDVEGKHEFYCGEMFAMGGASREHNRITVNLSALLHRVLEKTKCEHYVNDMRVKITATTLYTYPDVVVTCEKPQFDDEEFDTLLNPQVIIEVLSDSTESYDRGKKFEHYRQIPSLKEYLLVSQDHPHIERFVVGEDGFWKLNDATGLDATIEITSIDCRLPLAEVFAKVEFPEAPNRP